MDHQPFETWLLADEPLTPQQKHELQEHVKTCPACTAIAEVNVALKSVRMAAPAEGFTDRFQARLAARKVAQRRRNFWGFFILGLSVVSILVWIAWPVLSIAFESPVNLLASWLSTLISIWVTLQAMFHTGSVVFNVLPGFVPTYAWGFILFAAAAWCVIWVFSLLKLTKLQQGVQL
jgi:hypothetical protein